LRMVFRLVQAMQHLPRRVEDPIQKKRQEQQERKPCSQDEAIFRVPKGIAHGAHCQRCNDGGYACEEKDDSGNCPVLGLAEATNSL